MESCVFFCCLVYTLILCYIRTANETCFVTVPSVKTHMNNTHVLMRLVTVRATRTTTFKAQVIVFRVTDANNVCTVHVLV